MLGTHIFQNTDVELQIFTNNRVYSYCGDSMRVCFTKPVLLINSHSSVLPGNEVRPNVVSIKSIINVEIIFSLMIVRRSPDLTRGISSQSQAKTWWNTFSLISTGCQSRRKYHNLISFFAPRNQILLYFSFLQQIFFLSLIWGE